MRPLLFTVALTVALSGCGRTPVVLTREDGSRWDGRLDVGEERTIGAQLVIDVFSGYEVKPAVLVTVEDPSIATMGPDRYGFRITGVARGTTTLHVYAEGDVDPTDTTLVVGAPR